MRQYAFRTCETDAYQLYNRTAEQHFVIHMNRPSYVLPGRKLRIDFLAHEAHLQKKNVFN